MEGNDGGNLEDNGLKEFIGSNIPKLATRDAKNIISWKKNVAKVRRILLEGF